MASVGWANDPEKIEQLQTYLQPAEDYLKEQLGEGNVGKEGSSFIVNGITDEIAQKMGLKNVEHKDRYVIKFNVVNNTVEITYNSKINDDDQKNSWTLSEIEEL